MKKNILIIHFNTPYLTECLVRSINLHVKDAVIYIFDNSTEKPFTAKFDNVTVFDNTKGQIINFDKWLENYPNRKRSGGRINKWGSAKHCYSVEKCMELINDNFVLLDSDVLLKRDISNLFIEDNIFIAEIANQPNSAIQRVLPFICFINVKMCKRNNVHFFDDDYMHGLCKGRGSDSYDTGAGFLINARNYKHTEIKCSNYILHYGNGSWNKIGRKHEYTQEEWAKIYRKYWSNYRNKKVIYTCITGGYDRLLDPKYIDPDFDYICFTDNEYFTNDVWEIRPLPKEAEEFTKAKQQRFMKINPHLFLSDYDLSIWVDGNVTLKGNPSKFVQKTLTDDCAVFVPKHPSRNCIYKESTVVARMGKDKMENMKPQLDRYREEGFPENYGLLQSNILLRKHNDEGCIKLMETWFEELKNGSHRDQLSFNYAAWKNPDVKIDYMDKNICKSEYFYWNGVHTRETAIKGQHIDATQIATDFNEDSYEAIMWQTIPSIVNNHKKNRTLDELKADFRSMVAPRRMETYTAGIY